MQALKQTLYKSKHILLYGASMGVLVFVLKWLQWKYIISDNSLDIYMGLLALIFTLLGIWVATQISKPKTQTVVVEKEVYIPLPEPFHLNTPALQALGLSEREYEVLQLINEGRSNAEIAEELYLSVSTIKTHVSNLFVKMEVKSRTQAIEKAKRLKITP